MNEEPDAGRKERSNWAGGDAVSWTGKHKQKKVLLVGMGEAGGTSSGGNNKLSLGHVDIKVEGLSR